jgi:hypothetical protein
VLVAHAYNPSYSGGSDQEGRGSEPALADSSVRPCLEKTHHKKGTGGVTQGVDPEFKPQYWKKKNLGAGHNYSKKSLLGNQAAQTYHLI